MGAQIVGRYRGEAELLAFAAAWEAALDVASRRPALAHAETGVRTDRTRGGPTAIKELEQQWRPD